ncbi:MAG: hypothetical protein RIS44_1391 [Pseudomonadota bacterium]
MVWNINETLNLVKKQFGAEIRDAARASIYSADQRLRFAHYHFHEMKRLLNSFTEDHLTGRNMWEFADSPDESERVEYFKLMDQVAANAVACVQSVHAVDDLLASSVFYCLNLNQTAKSLEADKVHRSIVIERLAKFSKYAAIQKNLEALVNAPSFVHIDALSNQAKHSQIVRVLANEDHTGQRINRIELRFESFVRKRKRFQEVEVVGVLGPAYELASRTMVDVGNQLTKVLR